MQVQFLLHKIKRVFNWYLNNVWASCASLFDNCWLQKPRIHITFYLMIIFVDINNNHFLESFSWNNWSSFWKQGKFQKILLINWILLIYWIVWTNKKITEKIETHSTHFTQWFFEINNNHSLKMNNNNFLG